MSLERETDQNEEIAVMQTKRPLREKLMATVKDKWPYVQRAICVGIICFIPSLATSSLSSLTRGGDFSSSLIISASLSLLGALAGVDMERNIRWEESQGRLRR